MGLNGSGGTITDSYATGAVTGTANIGGLVGINTGAVINSFWDTQTTGQATSAGGTGMPTAPMQQQAHFTSATVANGNVNPAWDFVGTWVMYDGHTYPLLRVFMTPLTVTANFTKTYDGLSFASGSGVSNGASYSTQPDFANLFGTLSYGGTAQGAKDVGTYAVLPSGLFSDQQGYIISYDDSRLIVNPATLTETANSATMIYGGVLPALNGTISGFVNGETLPEVTTGALSFGSGATSSSGVGHYAINGGGLTPNGNYVIVQAASNARALSINPATLTVTAGDAAKIYGQTPVLTAFSASGLQNGETVGAVTLTSVGTAATASVAGSPYPINASNASGGTFSPSNYAIRYVDGTLAVSPATLTYSASPAIFSVGQTPVGLSGTVGGFVAGDSLASATSGALSWSTTADRGSQPGEYPIQGGGLNAANYAFVQAEGNATALKLNVAPPPETVVTATPQPVADVLATLASAKPAPFNLSPAITVRQIGNTAAGNDVTAVVPDQRASIALTIGASSPTLYVLDGGVRLPDGWVNGHE